MNNKFAFAALILVLLVVGYATIKGKKKDNPVPDLNSGPYAGPQGDLSKVKVAMLYEKVTDRELVYGRNLEETVKVIKGVNPDMIFRGFWIWNNPIPESVNNIPPEIANYVAERVNIKPSQVPDLIRELGYSYEELAKSISAIKKEMPGVIFVGAVPAQTVGRVEYNPTTGKVYGVEDTWKMALDPQKWNINYKYNGKLMTKEEIQFMRATNNQQKFDGNYDYRKAHGYFPDITNPDFQELFLGWSKKQIDEGADAIWIDMLYSQGSMLYSMTKDIDHPAVKESFDAASKMVDEIHKYGESKGKYIYVSTWSEPISNYPGRIPNLDFVTDTPISQEIQAGKFDEERWDRLSSNTKKKFGNIPHFAFIDWGGKPNAPIDVFSQNLNKKQQGEFLRKADAFFQSKGMNFIYPVRGADFWGNPKVRAFGKLTKYDALAPEFDTYDTIKELAQKKAAR